MRIMKKVFAIIAIIGITVLFGQIVEHLNQPPSTVVAFYHSVETTVDGDEYLRAARTMADSVAVELKNPPNCYVQIMPARPSIEAQEMRWACDNGKGNITWEEAQELGRTLSVTNINTKLYSWEYKGGNVLQFVDSSGGCSGSEYHAPNLGAFGWDNQVSSAESLGNCGRVTLYENNNYGGASITCTPYCATLGVMNNHASSTKTKR